MSIAWVSAVVGIMQNNLRRARKLEEDRTRDARKLEEIYKCPNGGVCTFQRKMEYGMYVGGLKCSRCGKEVSE